MTQFRVDSEVGKLRKVLVHRPDLSLRRLTPSNREELLFDDVLWVRKARSEHDRFVAHMERRGVEVFYLDDLLADVLKNPEARSFVIDKTVTRLTVGPTLVKEFRAYLFEMDPRRLATILIGGLAREAAAQAEELHVFHLGAQFRKCAFLDDAAAVDDADAVAEAFRFFQVMGREQHGRALGGDLANAVENQQPRLRVEAGGRFVQDQRLGLVDDAEYQRQSSQHAPRQLASRLIKMVGQLDPIQ